MVAVAPVGLDNPLRMSDDAWANLPEDEPGELVDGLLVEDEETGWLHEIAVGWLIQRLFGWASRRGGFVAASGLKYLLGPGHGRKPDVSMILPGQRPPPAYGVLRKPPDVMVEVLSSRPCDVRRDRIEKVRDYAAFGTKYYWLLDPTVKTLEILERSAEGRYTVALAADSGKVLAVPGCDGLVLDLDGLWAEIDALGEEEEEGGDDEVAPGSTNE